jgi:hypothetical protein
MKKNTFVGIITGLLSVSICLHFGYSILNWQWWVIVMLMSFTVSIGYSKCK